MHKAGAAGCDVVALPEDCLGLGAWEAASWGNLGETLAAAEIDPTGGRRNEDWANEQDDMHARLYRERRPEAFGVLTDRHPPVLDRLPEMIPAPPRELARMYHRMVTVGHEQWDTAEEHRTAGRPSEAIQAYRALRREYPCSWFDRMARERLETLEGRTAR